LYPENFEGPSSKSKSPVETIERLYRAFLPRAWPTFLAAGINPTEFLKPDPQTTFLQFIFVRISK
jgi:hypothetical protein